LTVSRKSLLLVGLLTFVAAVILMFPARVAYDWFAPPAVQLSSLEGTIWSGSAAEVSAAGLYLRDSYRSQPVLRLPGSRHRSRSGWCYHAFERQRVAAAQGLCDGRSRARPGR
jgi:hypothetical protein